MTTERFDWDTPEVRKFRDDCPELHATLLHCLGIDHTRLTFKFQGRHHRLTDVHGEVVKGIVA